MQNHIVAPSTLWRGWELQTSLCMWHSFMIKGLLPWDNFGRSQASWGRRKGLRGENTPACNWILNTFNYCCTSHFTVSVQVYSTEDNNSGRTFMSRIFSMVTCKRISKWDTKFWQNWYLVGSADTIVLLTGLEILTLGCLRLGRWSDSYIAFDFLFLTFEKDLLIYLFSTYQDFLVQSIVQVMEKFV